MTALLIYISWPMSFQLRHARIQRGWNRGSGPPEKSQNYRFFGSTVPEPLKNLKTTKLAFNVWPRRPASETLFQWPASVVSGSSHPSSKKSCQSWTLSDKTFWIRVCEVSWKSYKTDVIGAFYRSFNLQNWAMLPFWITTTFLKVHSLINFCQH